MPNLRNISCWGDSITYYGYPQVLQSLLPEITVTNFGVAGEHSWEIADRMIAATDRYQDKHVFWVGVNEGWYQPTIMDSLARMVAVLDHSCFLVLMPVTGSGANAPPAPPHMADLKSAIQSAYPDNFFDMREYLYDYANPQVAQDAIDVANDTVPGSLRTDVIHPKPFTCSIIAERVFKWFADKEKIY